MVPRLILQAPIGIRYLWLPAVRGENGNSPRAFTFNQILNF